jgi:hypothetical protein
LGRGRDKGPRDQAAHHLFGHRRHRCVPEVRGGGQRGRIGRGRRGGRGGAL